MLLLNVFIRGLMWFQHRSWFTHMLLGTCSGHSRKLSNPIIDIMVLLQIPRSRLGRYWRAPRSALPETTDSFTNPSHGGARCQRHAYCRGKLEGVQCYVMVESSFPRVRIYLKTVTLCKRRPYWLKIVIFSPVLVHRRRGHPRARLASRQDKGESPDTVSSGTIHYYYQDHIQAKWWV